MAVKTYFDATAEMDLTGLVVKQETEMWKDMECPECKGWVRVNYNVGTFSYMGNPVVIEQITHLMPCYTYRKYLKSKGLEDYQIRNRN